MFADVMLTTARGSADEPQAQAEELADILTEMQRCFLLNLSEELKHGSVSFPQFFLLAFLAKQEVTTMSAIAAKISHTTAAATGLVDRLEKLRFVERSHAADDRRKVLVKITKKGSTLVLRLRQDMVEKITLILREHLTVEEGKAWLEIYRKIFGVCKELSKKA